VTSKVNDGASTSYSQTSTLDKNLVSNQENDGLIDDIFNALQINIDNGVQTRPILKDKFTQTPIYDINWDKVTKITSLSFQSWDDLDKVKILPAAKDFWRDVRSCFNDHIKHDLRASQIQQFMDLELTPTLAYSWGCLPRYMKQTPQCLIDLKVRHAQETMETLKTYMEEESKNARIKGQTFQRLIKEMYEIHNKDNEYKLDEAEEKIRELLGRDLKKLTKDTADITEKQSKLPKLTSKDIGRISIKGPCQFSTLLNQFEETEDQDKKNNKKNNNRNAPYDRRGRGRGRGRFQ
jgi:hypothetical protein